MRLRRGMTTGWGTRVARALSVASGAVLVAVLAGCSLGESQTDDPSEIPSSSSVAAAPSADAPPAFHFKSGDLVLGDFTYEDVAGNIFNPCEEISAEEFAAIGFETDGRVVRDRMEEKFACRLFDSGDPGAGYKGLISSPVSFEDVEDQVDIYDVSASKKVPSVYTHGTTDPEVRMCYASVDTERGQVSAVAESREASSSGCAAAIEIIEKLYGF